MNTPSSGELEQIYRRRFGDITAFRNRIWQVLVSGYFQRFVRPADAVLDLGCGYGEFINNVSAAKKFAIDLNPSARAHLDASVTLFEQDSSAPWPVEARSLDVVFTSNFLEHLPTKAHVNGTLRHAHTAVKPGGRIILMGPNIRYIHGAYWDFWDHYIPISDLSLVEALRGAGFEPEQVYPRFLPYTMAGRRSGAADPLMGWALRAYLALPIAWKLLGKQFLIIARPA